MMPILYGADETAFTSNGVGILSDAADCTVTEILKRSNELELKYPIKGIHFADIRQRAIIVAKPNPIDDPQPYRVYRITKPMNDLVTVYAHHIAYDLMGITVIPFSASSAAAALAALKDNAVTDCPFEFATDVSTLADMTVTEPQSIWILMGNDENGILSLYGGEYEFDKYNIRLSSHRGLDRGVSIRYGKNLTSLEQDENCAGCYTAVHPYWKDSDGNVVQLSERIVQAPGNHGYTKVMPLDMSQDFDSAPTEEQLRAATEKYIEENGVGIPAVSWKVQFVQLEQTEEYKGTALLERVLLGDTVTVQYAEMGVSATARAVEVRYKPILDRYDSVTLGEVKADLADTIVSHNKQISKKPSQSQMQVAIETLTTALLGARGGAARLLDTDGDEEPDTLYIADDPDPEKAIKVWRFNYEGWGASSNGYNGPFEMGATLKGGIVADFITAGTLYGLLVKSGAIESDSGKIRIDLTADDLVIFNSGISTNGLFVRADEVGANKLFEMEAVKTTGGFYCGRLLFNSVDGTNLFRLVELFDRDGAGLAGVASQWQSRDGAMTAWASATNDTVGYLFTDADDNTKGHFVMLPDGTVSLAVTEINGKKVSWVANADGKYMLAGED